MIDKISANNILQILQIIVSVQCNAGQDKAVCQNAWFILGNSVYVLSRSNLQDSIIQTISEEGTLIMEGIEYLY